jgi:hypothetical protein
VPRARCCFLLGGCPRGLGLCCVPHFVWFTCVADVRAGGFILLVIWSEPHKTFGNGHAQGKSHGRGIRSRQACEVHILDQVSRTTPSVHLGLVALCHRLPITSCRPVPGAAQETVVQAALSCDHAGSCRSSLLTSRLQFAAWLSTVN